MTSYVNFAIIKKSCSYVYNKIKTEEDNSQILEPFRVLVKLALLSFKKDGTKLSITNNRVSIQEPYKLQGAVRYINGNKREELSQLMKPLIRCIQLYPVYNEDDEKNEHLEYIYQKAIEGLTKLKSNYDKNLSTVCHSLDFYITIINSHLEGENIRVASFEDSKQISNLTLSTNTQINIENIFKGIWEKDDVELIYNMLKTTDKSGNLSYLTSINDFLKTKDSEINIKVKNIKKLI